MGPIHFDDLQHLAPIDNSLQYQCVRMIQTLPLQAMTVTLGPRRKIDFQRCAFDIPMLLGEYTPDVLPCLVNDVDMWNYSRLVSDDAAQLPELQHEHSKVLLATDVLPRVLRERFVQSSCLSGFAVRYPGLHSPEPCRAWPLRLVLKLSLWLPKQLCTLECLEMTPILSQEYPVVAADAASKPHPRRRCMDERPDCTAHLPQLVRPVHEPIVRAIRNH